MTANLPVDPRRLALTPKQRADDPAPSPVVEALAVHLYESDTESEYNLGDDVEWRYNYAHRDRYRSLALAALDFLTREAKR
jgi:hypothetical protein